MIGHRPGSSAAAALVAFRSALCKSWAAHKIRLMALNGVIRGLCCDAAKLISATSATETKVGQVRSTSRSALGSEGDDIKCALASLLNNSDSNDYKSQSRRMLHPILGRTLTTVLIQSSHHTDRINMKVLILG